MTVAPSGSGFETAESQCRTGDMVGSWVTEPEQTLDVLVEGISGTVSENAWPGTCMCLSPLLSSCSVI
jgi:hypothetical protein